tara:strand:+ start:350 stop:466 length:117 start_codon:yes stop_codon:yes gene_type:complete
MVHFLWNELDKLFIFNIFVKLRDFSAIRKMKMVKKNEF